MTQAHGGYDPESVRSKYLAERDKRLILGRADIRDLDGDDLFGRYREDPFTPLTQRDALQDDVDVCILGGGIAGITLGAELRKAGVENIRFVLNRLVLNPTNVVSSIESLNLYRYIQVL